MSIKPLLTLLGFIGWSVLCTYWYCCWMQVACESCGAEAYAAYHAPPTHPVAATSAAAPIAFQLNKAEFNSPEELAEIRAKMLEGKKEDNVLEITGLYFEGEPIPDSMGNLGLARANEMKLAMLDDLTPERIRTKARLVKEPEGAQDRGFYGIEYRWLDADKTSAATLEEFADRVIIRFPYNSTKKDYDPVVDEYLNKLAERVVQSGEKISITGHTDNEGEADYNMDLGKQRAESIRDYLSNAKVKAEQMLVQSKGETQPVAPNDTDENRHANRRVEVVLLTQ